MGAHNGGSLRGHAEPQVTFRNRFPSVSGLDWQRSRLRTDYVGVAKVSVHDVALDPVCGMSAQCRYQADTYIHAG